MIDPVRAIDNARLYKPNSNILLKKIAPAAPNVMAAVGHCVKLVLELP